MATRVTLVTLADSTVAVSKTPLSGDRRDRVAEARWLERAAGAVAETPGGQHQRAGVVQLLASDPSTPETIMTERVAGETLRTTWLAPSGVAAALARVAELLADLHEHELVHGNLTLDHVILGPDGPRLCSPDGQTSDHESDARALGRCLETLLQRWDRLDVAVHDRAEWERLARALLATAQPLPLRRLVVALDRLAASPQGRSDTPAVERTDAAGSRMRRLLSIGDGLRPIGGSSADGATTAPSEPRRPLRMIAGALLILATLGGVALGIASPDAAGAGSEVTIDGHRYRIDADHTIVTLGPDPCPGQPWVVSFDASTDTIWAFEKPLRVLDPGQSAGGGVMLFVVPGAERLEVVDKGSCPTVWAAGPIGRTKVVDG